MFSKEVRGIIKKNIPLEDKIKAIDPEVMAVIREERARAVVECSERIMQQVDTCYTAAIINQNADAFTLLDLEEIRLNADKYLIENGDFIKELKGEWKNYLNKVDLEVGERIFELLEDKKTQLDIFKIIKKEYPKLKSSHINVAFKSAKTEWLKPSLVIPISPAELEKEIMLNKVKFDKGGKDMQKIITNGKSVPVKKEVKVKEVAEVKSPFTVKSKEIVLQGEHNEYKIYDNILESGNIVFRSKEDIENYEKSELDHFKDVMAELKLAWLEV